MNIHQDTNYITFTLKTAQLTVRVLEHLKQHNPFDNTIQTYTLSRVGSSRLFQIKNNVVSQAEVEHLFNTKQIGA